MDIVLPCATQNEIDETDAKVLIHERKCQLLVEGSNLSSTAKAIEIYKEREDEDGATGKAEPGRSFYYVGSKLANLGGVGTSYLEMQQNASKDKWEAARVDAELQSIMTSAFSAADERAVEFGVSITDGANIAAFLKVANAMLQLGFL